MASNSGGKPPHGPLTQDNKSKKSPRKSIETSQKNSPPPPKHPSQKGLLQLKAEVGTQPLTETPKAVPKLVNKNSEHDETAQAAIKAAEAERVKTYQGQVEAEKQKQANYSAKKKQEGELAVQKRLEAEAAAAEKKYQAELAAAKKPSPTASKSNSQGKNSSDNMSHQPPAHPTAPSRSSIKHTQPSSKKIPEDAHPQKTESVTLKKRPSQPHPDQRQPSKSITSIESREKSFHEELSPKVFHNFDAALVFGPDAFIRNYQWYERRCKRIGYSLSGIAVAIALLTAVIQFSLHIIPQELAARYILHTIFYGDGVYILLNCWGPVIVGYAMCIYGVVLIQWPKLRQWKRLGRSRWLVQVLLDLYLVAVLAYYFVEMARIEKDVEADMRHDLEFHKGYRVETSQNYYRCCGIRSYKDWEILAKDPKQITKWIGNLCLKEEFYMIRNPNVEFEIVCHIPSSCWNTTGLDYNDKASLTISHWPNACLSWEVGLAYSLVALYNFILFSIIIALTVVFYYLRRVIVFSNKNNIDLKPRYQFEECL